jgi:hypothetical protein
LRCTDRSSSASSSSSLGCFTETWAPGVLDPDNAPPEFLERFYGEVSPDGPAHYPVVVFKLAQMHAEGPTLAIADLINIRSRTSHELLVEKPALCNTIIVDFLATDPVPTMAPIRRR